jgi:isopenicillin-N epimerase
LHPLSISHGYGQGWRNEFDWTGTRDISGWLAVTAALDFHERLGGPSLRFRNRQLAAEAATLIAARLGSETGCNNTAANAMGIVRLPLRGAASPERALALREHLLTAGTDAPLHMMGGSIWLRISAQAYNEMADFSRLADLIRRELADSLI